jgi:hypothetical protein
MFKAKSNNKEENDDKSSISIIPIAFTIVPLHVEERHEELQNIVKQDIKDHPKKKNERNKIER